MVPSSDCFCDNCMMKYYREGLIDKGTPAYEQVKELLKNRKTKIISGFPAVGKSYLTKDCHLTVLDSDSSLFSWISDGVRHPDFPQNYMQHIKENIGKVDYILVSSHDIVRKALKENSIEYSLVYPSIELKDEYLERYKNRGNDEKFVSFINSKWDEFINDIETETFPSLIKLNHGQFLSDIFSII
jgi:hypothetical protein